MVFQFIIKPQSTVYISREDKIYCLKFKADYNIIVKISFISLNNFNETFQV